MLINFLLPDKSNCWRLLYQCSFHCHKPEILNYEPLKAVRFYFSSLVYSLFRQLCGVTLISTICWRNTENENIILSGFFFFFFQSVFHHISKIQAWEHWVKDKFTGMQPPLRTLRSSVFFIFFVISIFHTTAQFIQHECCVMLSQIQAWHKGICTVFTP